jgi:pantetheine-phosphate adenylyltransferase
MKTAIYPGTFDPFTNGHDDILRRALRVFDKVIILVAVSPVKRSLFTQDQRVEMINDHLSDEPKASVDSWDGLIVDYAKKHKINEMEFQMASMNNHLYEEIDTFFLPTGGKHYFVSSSLVKELHKNGRDIAEFIPESVLKYIKAP